MTDSLKKNLPAVSPRTWEPGERLDHRKLNEPIAAIKRLNAAIQPPSQKRPNRVATATTFGQCMIITAIEDEYLVCNEYDFVSAGESDIYVAKPWGVRKYADFPTAPSYTYSSAAQRSATLGEDSETQLITPAYEVGEIIIALRVPATGITVDGERVEWIDITPGRYWASAPGD